MSARVLVGLSGGVDSSLTTWLLKQQGRDVGALFMKNWEEDDSEACPAEADAEDARRVAAATGVPFFARNFAAEYWDGVFEHFLAELRRGRTPNPDVLCNREVKFKTFVEQAQDLGYPKIATGHYAQVRERDGRFELLRGADPGKDQSYFLYALEQSQLAVAEFPIGHLRKSEVRALAAQANLPTASKRDSTGICFIGERAFDPFIQRYLGSNPGAMITPDGEQIGEHRGLHFYTIGQRGGLGIGGRKGGSGEPWFVLDKRAADNTLIVAQGEHALLYARSARLETPHFVAGSAPSAEFRCTAKTRYRQPDQTCTVTLHSTGAKVVFDTPQRALTPGQSVVFYQGEICLGGAVLDVVDRI